MSREQKAYVFIYLPGETVAVPIVTLISKLVILTLLLSLTGCVSAGGGAAARVNTTTRAILKLTAHNIPAGKSVSAIQASLQLPVGVTPGVLKGNDASGSVVASGLAAGAMVASSYNSETRIMTYGVVFPSGFPAGEFLTITCKVADGTVVTASDFPAQAKITQILDSSMSADSLRGATCPVAVTFQ